MYMHVWVRRMAGRVLSRQPREIKVRGTAVGIHAHEPECVKMAWGQVWDRTGALGRIPNQ